MTNKLNCIKKGAKYIIGAAVLATSLSSAVFGLSKEGLFGNGEYYKIYNGDDLREFAELVNGGKECDAKGKLMDDIDLDCKNSGEWIPIGTEQKPFRGEVISNDNKVKTITGLYIHELDEDYQGLFGYIKEGGIVKNVMIYEAEINGKDNIGGIAGYNQGTIENCYAMITIKGNEKVGGLIGLNQGTMKGGCCIKDDKTEGKSHVEGKSYVGGNVGRNGGTMEGYCINGGVVVGSDHVGGNVGQNEGTIKLCENSGKVLTENGECVGGNIGLNMGEIEDCQNNEEVVGGHRIGGNVGQNQGTIGKCENFRRVITKDGYYVGGNIGYIGKDGSVNKCINKGFSRGIEIECQGKEYVGGNVGCNQGTIKEECSNSVYVYGIDNHVGGNVGQNEGTIKLCENNGKVITENGKYVGGNIGYIGEDGSVEKCINKGIFQGTEVECQGKEYVGGNVGCNQGTIKEECSNSAFVCGIDSYVGGNIGFNEGIIPVYCINQGNIGGKEYVGGNIGLNFNQESVIQCENKGDIEGNRYVGGNIGANYGAVGGNIGANYGAKGIKCKNEGAVKGKEYVGGNIGSNVVKVDINDIIINTGTVNEESAHNAKKIGVQY